jgi:hypothetical protein
MALWETRACVQRVMQSVLWGPQHPEQAESSRCARKGRLPFKRFVFKEHPLRKTKQKHVEGKAKSPCLVSRSLRITRFSHLRPTLDLSGKLRAVLVSTVNLSFGSHQGPWRYFRSQDFYAFLLGLPFDKNRGLTATDYSLCAGGPRAVSQSVIR